MNSMLFIIDKNIPAEAKASLTRHGEVLEFSTNDLTYPSISNHPDIFFCKVNGILYYSPNTPHEFIQQLSSKGINVSKGSVPVGPKYPHSALYNAVVTDKYFIHNLKLTDVNLKHAAEGRKLIDVKQGYTRCSLLPLKNNCFITSDEGINKKLLSEGLEVQLVKPNCTQLPGEEYGLFGGTSGISGNRIFILGNLKYFPEGSKVKSCLENLNYEIIELYNGPLYDGGSILIIE
jgi:hypothetical protein